MLMPKILYAVFLCVLGIFWILYRGTLSLQLFLLGLSVPVLMLIYVLIQRFLIDGRIRRENTEVQKGDTFRWVLRLRNRSVLPVTKAVVKLEYKCLLENVTREVKLSVSLLPLNTQRVNLSFQAATCGVMEMRLCTMKIYDPLRLFSATIRLHTADSFLVMPQCAELDADDITTAEQTDAESTEYSKHKSGDDPSEVFEIHEYRSGDAVSRIHWKLSSKLDSLMVKAYSLPIPSDILLALDYRICGGSAETAARLDAMLSMLYAVSNLFRTRSQPQRVLWYRTAAQHFSDCQLEEPEDTEEMLRQVLRDAPSDYAIEELPDALEHGSKTTRMLLFTPKLDARMVALLPMLSNQRALTVFYVTSEAEADILPDGAEEYDCIPVFIQQNLPQEHKKSEWEGDERP